MIAEEYNFFLDKNCRDLYNIRVAKLNGNHDNYYYNYRNINGNINIPAFKIKIATYMNNHIYINIIVPGVKNILFRLILAKPIDRGTIFNFIETIMLANLDTDKMIQISRNFFNSNVDYKFLNNEINELNIDFDKLSI